MNWKNNEKLDNHNSFIELKVISDKTNINSDILCRRCSSAHLYKKGKTTTGKQRYHCKECGYLFVANPEWTKLENSDETLTASELGVQIHLNNCHGDKLNLSKIQQKWFQEEVRRFLKYKANNCSWATLNHYLESFKTFSGFLAENSPIQSIENIERSTITDYLNYLQKQEINWKYRNDKISHLKNLFESGNINGWFNVSAYLIHEEDWQKRIKRLPRYIPEEVMSQLNEHLDALPEPLMRMVLVIQECGLRIGELCNLPLNCLKQDTKGGWFIQFMRWKMNTETTLPISIELSKVIQEQQQYIHDNFGEAYKYLFCGATSGNKRFIPKPKVMSNESFIGYLKRLAEKFSIQDASGKLWNFQTHQFRHTVGTRMINNGVPQHIVQRYLGHESPQMTMVYAHIHDATLRKEIDKYLDTKVVNINGEVIESLHPELDNDGNLQWMKKKVLAETLPNGYCGLPAQLTCSKGNACLTCGDFRTTIEFLNQHKEHLKRTTEVLKVAKANGWQRQIQVNEDVKKSLENIINTLEDNKNE
jgi:integrase/recombinase XerD